jgi:hypothetical protein
MNCQKWKKNCTYVLTNTYFLNLKNNIFTKVASTGQKMFFSISIFVDIYQKVILKRKKNDYPSEQPSNFLVISDRFTLTVSMTLLG